MDKLTRQFFGDAKRVKLSSAEKAQSWDQISMRASSRPVQLSSLEKSEGLDRLLSHMKKHPIAHGGWVRHFFALHRVGAMAMVALLLIGAGGGGVVYAAEDAMPEDILYPVKLHFNEPLIGAFHRTPERRAEWEQRRLDRRLREAEHLSERSTEFTPERREMLQQRIESRIDMFQKHIENLPEDRRVELEDRMQDRFDRHQEFLQKIEEGEVSREEFKQFKQHIQKVRPPKMRNQPSDTLQQRPSVVPILQKEEKELPTHRLRPVEKMPPSSPERPKKDILQEGNLPP